MLKRFKVRIIKYTEPWTWYVNRIGETYTTIFDPLIGKYVAIDNGGASRCIEPQDCEIIENDEESE